MKKLSFLALACYSIVSADAPLRLHKTSNESPWFTGPLLTPSAYVVKAGHVNFEPYVYATATTGIYNSEWNALSTKTTWDIVTQSYLQIGLTSWAEIQLVPTTTETIANGSSSFQFNDFPFQIQFQLYNPGPDEWLPAVKLTFGEVFPIGKYSRLNPSLNGTDSAGEGSYQTVVGITLGQLFALGSYYFTTLRLAAYEIFPTSVSIHGLSTYGGSLDADGVIHPGLSTEIYIGWEISLARHWSFACDAYATFQGSTTFTGNPGTKNAPPGVGSSAQFSLAPAIEWNWGRNIGLISGVWFSVAGRNTSEFISWTTAINYYY